MNIENHTLSLMISYGFSFPLDIHCAMISGCGEGADECVSYTCSSESARFEVQGINSLAIVVVDR